MSDFNSVVIAEELENINSSIAKISEALKYYLCKLADGCADQDDEELTASYAYVKSDPTMDVFGRYVNGACTAKVEVGTNGLKGGDAGHGSRTYIRIKNEGGMYMKVWSDGDDFSIKLGGDWELLNIIEAFKFVVDVLEKQIAGEEVKVSSSAMRREPYASLPSKSIEQIGE